MIDFTKPVETTEDPPRPVRVLSNFNWNGNECFLAELPSGVPIVFTDDGKNAVLGLTLRNVPAKPVLLEGWVNLYSNRYIKGTIQYTKREADDVACEGRAECRRIVWNSDGSPVEDDAAKARHQHLMDVIAERDLWKLKAENFERKHEATTKELIHERQVAVSWREKSNAWEINTRETLALLVRQNDSYEKLLCMTEAQQGVVDAALLYVEADDADECEDAYDILQRAVYIYRNKQPATSDSHEAMSKED